MIFLKALLDKLCINIDDTNKKKLINNNKNNTIEKESTMSTIFKDKALGQVKVTGTYQMNYYLSESVFIKLSFLALTQIYGDKKKYVICLDTGYIDDTLQQANDESEKIISTIIKDKGFEYFMEQFNKGNYCKDYWKYYDSYMANKYLFKGDTV